MRNNGNDERKFMIDGNKVLKATKQLFICCKSIQADLDINNAELLMAFFIMMQHDCILNLETQGILQVKE